jgi:hypothetical protein
MYYYFKKTNNLIIIFEFEKKKKLLNFIISTFNLSKFNFFILKLIDFLIIFINLFISIFPHLFFASIFCLSWNLFKILGPFGGLNFFFF